MRLIDDLNGRIADEHSMFRAQLMREDVARLEKLRVMARAAEDEAQFRKDGAYIGWTQSDMHTHKIKDAIDALLVSVYAYERGDKDAAAEAALDAAWVEFNNQRMEKLIRCL